MVVEDYVLQFYLVDCTVATEARVGLPAAVSAPTRGSHGLTDYDIKQLRCLEVSTIEHILPARRNLRYHERLYGAPVMRNSF